MVWLTGDILRNKLTSNFFSWEVEILILNVIFICSLGLGKWLMRSETSNYGFLSDCIISYHCRMVILSFWSFTSYKLSLYALANIYSLTSTLQRPPLHLFTQKISSSWNTWFYLFIAEFIWSHHHSSPCPWLLLTVLNLLIRRVKHNSSVVTKSSQSMRLILAIGSLYCLWCTSQIYWRNPPQPAIGEEADLGVLIFLTIYFFLPHGLCILSMNPKYHLDTPEELPL